MLEKKLRQKQTGIEGKSSPQSPTPGCDVRKNFGVQCEQADEVSTAYADMHRDPYLILLKSMETFPPTSAPINLLDEQKVRAVLAEKKAGVDDVKEQAMMKEFKTSQPTLLPLKLEWTFGINRHVPFINLTSARHSSIFHSAGQTAVLYSYDETDSKQEPTQILLEGLSRQITCIATTRNGRWLAAGDTGSDYSAIVWDQKDALPLRMYSQPNGKDAYGLTSICFSPDMRFLAMLSSGPRQVLTIFEWLVDKKGKGEGQDMPVVHYQLAQQEDMHSQLSFSPLDQSILMSCSQSGVALYKWNIIQTTGQVRICIPNIQKVPNSMVLGELTRAVFVPLSTYFVIGTMNGTIALFQKRISHKSVLAFENYAEIVKVYKVVENGAVTALTSLNGMVVVGDSLGNVNFYDCNFLLLYTCSNIGFGSINNISFSRIRAHKELAINFANKALFLSEFLIGTSTGHIVKVRTTGDDVYETKLVREEPPDAVIACAVHPNAYRLLIGSSDGLLRMWDYKHKSVLVQRRFPVDKKEDLLSKDITSLAFDPTGIYVACGFANGALRLLKAVDLSDEPDGNFADSFAKILFIEFADDGTKLATADGEGLVCLYRNNTRDWNKTWVNVGCHQSHIGAVLNLAFVREVGVEKDRLFTLGLDGCLVEYDLDQSGDGDLLIQYREMIDSEEQPFAFALYPPINKESFLITSNNKYKLKLWNVTTKLCRKTINGPLQGSPIMGMTALPLREGNSNRYLLWRNADCVGLMALPLDGNPYRYCSRRVHPLGMTCMKPSPSGRFVFTAGGPEAIVNMWSVHPEILDASLEASKDSLIPFFDLLEGGMDGELYKRLEQYFVYLQLKMQGLETRETRVVQDVLPLQEVPNLFCALSYYPSEQEKKNIMQEIKYSQYAETGLLVDQVDVPTALKTFVNHRPMWGIQYPDLTKAFAKFGFEELRTCIKPAQLVQILKGIGESMSEEEAVNTLSVLTNLRPPLADWEGVGAERDFFIPGTTLPKEFTVKDVIEKVFGFQTTDAFYGSPDN